ncbi:MAG: N-6 DNA methylase [Anaerolineae bacterium]|nr:N-6 DNA methylase [Anaerolineae bacterium]
MTAAQITPKHPAIRAYYDKRQQLSAQNVSHELAVREAFKGLLEQMATSNKWTLVIEQKVEGIARVIRPDGTLRDSNTLPRGYWEAKDTRDDLDAEIEKKFTRGYPKSNIIFEDTRRAVLYQSGQRAGDYDLMQPEQVAALISRFLSYTEPNIAAFDQAVERFKGDTAPLAEGLKTLIADAHQTNKAFQTAFAAFFELCKTALNPNISRDAVNEMLIQHLLTERLMRTVFDNPDFVRRNAIAAEVEKVIDALTSRSFSRKDFLGQLDYFYQAIENAAQTLTDFASRQTFINAVYERFFQGYAVKVADTHGIVYTPQPIVDFMCASVEQVLRDQFGYGLDHPEVCIIDPCTGTGNFIINLLHRIKAHNPAALPDVYANRLFANEVMLLPYYIASLNIEHTYYDLAKRYDPFEGLCFVDTLDLAQSAQLSFLTEKNSQRVERQKQAKITVIIGNPPYNVGQLNENDNNKNRKYKNVDDRVRETYAFDSAATNKNALSDPYVKFFRWASDRLQGRDGVVCYVSNNSFVDQIAFDGMRKHLLKDFTHVYHLDLHGNVRQNPKLSGTTHNVFGIQVGVGITIAVRSSRVGASGPDAPTQTLDTPIKPPARLLYHRVPDDWRADQKLAFLTEKSADPLQTVAWGELIPDARNTWLVPENADEFAAFIPIGSKATKAAKGQDAEAIFKTYGRGVATSRDEVAYDFSRDQLIREIQAQIEDYNAEVDRYKRAGKPKDVDNFVKYDRVKWSEGLKANLTRGNYAEYNERKVRLSLYRPFTKQHLFFDTLFNERRYQFPHIFPTAETEQENLIICLSGLGHTVFSCLMSMHIVELKYANQGDGGTQCFPFYTYDEDGTNRRENITDWALKQFQQRYPVGAQHVAPLPPSSQQSPAPVPPSPLPDTPREITKWDIFYYVYALLHHPAYRAKFADNLKRELPRIPFAPDFWSFAEAGKKLAELHLNYETLEPYPLEYHWIPGKPVSYRVEKMRPLNIQAAPSSSSPRPEGEGSGVRVSYKTFAALQFNDALTLEGIPAAAFDYRLGNRSALDWVIDQYQAKDNSDPNLYNDDEHYIVKLVGRVVRVSVETAHIVANLPPFTA